MRQFLQDSSNRGDGAGGNRFADAFVQATYDLSDAQHNPHHPPSQNFYSDFGITYFDNWYRNTSVFWVSYVAAAYQRDDAHDYDRDAIINGQVQEITSYENDSGKGETDGNESLVWLEHNYDHWQTHHLEMNQVAPNTTIAGYLSLSADWLEQVARTTVHEVGHQFGLAHDTDDPTKMHMFFAAHDVTSAYGTHSVPLDKLWFREWKKAGETNSDLKKIRKAKMPGLFEWQ